MQILKICILSFTLILGQPVTGMAEAKWVQVQKDTGFVTFTFDDGTTSQFSEAFPIMREAGLPATVFIPSGMLDNNPDDFFMSWDNVRAMANAGWEIGGHTVTHRVLPTLDDLEVVGELVWSQDRIEEEVEVRPISVASPFGEYDQRTLSHIDKYYDLHVRAWGDNLGFNNKEVSPLLVERVNVDSSLTAADVCAMVRSVESNDWLVLMFHQVTDQPAPFHSSPKQLKEIADCAYEAQLQNKVTVDTLVGAFKSIVESQRKLH